MASKVLVTGISGYIAAQVAKTLLEKGYAVRGTVRSLSKSNLITEAFETQGIPTENLEFIEANLDQDEGWDQAFDGVEYLQHIASPFPISQPKDREALVPQAVGGTLRVLEAAKKAKVKKVVVTSSMVAMAYRGGRKKVHPVLEEDWTDTEWKALSPYVVSKTRAEKALWAWAEENSWTSKIVTVNPGLVLGPSLLPRVGTSLGVIKLIMEGAYPALPKVSYAVVDVRDVALMQVAVLQGKKSNGRRLMAAGEVMSMQDMALLLKNHFPEKGKKIPTGTLPNWLIRFLSVFDNSIRSVLPDLGVAPEPHSAYVKELTGVGFRPAQESVIDSAKTLIDHKQVEF
jgi:nucleoside-diphosphate-sugar epimerase